MGKQMVLDLLKNFINYYVPLDYISKELQLDYSEVLNIYNQLVEEKLAIKFGGINYIWIKINI